MLNKEENKQRILKLMVSVQLHEFCFTLLKEKKIYQWSYINWWLWRASSFLAYKLKKLYMDMKILQKSSLAVIHKHTQIHIMEVQIDHVHDNRFASASVYLLECPGSDDPGDLPISVWWTQSHMIVRRISLLRFHQSWWLPPFPDLEVSAML